MAWSLSEHTKGEKRRSSGYEFTYLVPACESADCNNPRWFCENVEIFEATGLRSITDRERGNARKRSALERPSEDPMRLGPIVCSVRGSGISRSAKELNTRRANNLPPEIRSVDPSGPFAALR
jgi:hypothetical protein